MDKELPVSVWPEWEIIEKIGEGSFGKVYKAKRTEQGRSFYSAIKILTIPGSPDELNEARAEGSGEDSARAYFKNLMEDCVREVSTMECFRGNSHIVSVEDYKVVEYLDEIGWEIYIRMEFLTGFLDYSAGRVITEKEILKLGCDLALALEYCEKLQIIHRDIKPENIFVSNFGDFKLGDFGIARELERSMSSMSKKGTYAYMAPEMYRGEQYDLRVDIYSLGIMMYRLLNGGRMPFLSREKQLITYRDKENALAKRMSGEPIPPPAKGSEELVRIVLKACAYRPEERYQNPGELYMDLDELRDGRIRDERRELAAQKEPFVQNLLENRRIRINLPKINPVVRRCLIFSCSLLGCVLLILGARVALDRRRIARNSGKVASVLEANRNSTAQVDEFSTAIDTIVEQANTIMDELSDCTEVGKEGDKFRYYDKEGKLVMAFLYPEASDDGVYEEYYYWEERLFFAYVWTDTKEELYYYDTRGKLIRWIDQDGTVHDKENDSTEYTKRGEKYWKVSLEQFDE